LAPAGGCLRFCNARRHSTTGAARNHVCSMSKVASVRMLFLAACRSLVLCSSARRRASSPCLECIFLRRESGPATSQSLGNAERAIVLHNLVSFVGLASDLPERRRICLLERMTFDDRNPSQRFLPRLSDRLSFSLPFMSSVLSTRTAPQHKPHSVCYDKSQIIWNKPPGTATPTPHALRTPWRGGVLDGSMQLMSLIYLRRRRSGRVFQAECQSPCGRQEGLCTENLGKSIAGHKNAILLLYIASNIDRLGAEIMHALAYRRCTLPL
jgi:hypothetical protein